jgi:hypothetical protein
VEARKMKRTDRKASKGCRRKGGGRRRRKEGTNEE